MFGKALGCIRLYSNASYLHHIGKTPLQYISLGKQFELTTLKYPERDAVVSLLQNQRLTYKEVLDQADRFAAGLQRIGIKYGDRVGLWAPNIAEWEVVAIACARAGFIVVTINPAYLAKELEYCINKVGLKTIICPEKYKKLNFYDILNEIVPNLEKQQAGKLNNEKTPTLNSIIAISDNSLRATFNYNDVMQMASDNSITSIKSNQNRISSDHPVNIQFTSGTTGKPKAAVISNFSFVNNAFTIGKRNELDTKHHKICVQVPFFHAFGYTITMGAAVAYGATLVLPSPTYNPLHNLKAIKSEKCTAIHGTPTMYVDLVNAQIQENEDINPEIAVSGGAPCSPELFKKMKDHLKVKKVKSVYGLSETTAVVFQSIPVEDDHKSNTTVGHLGDHIEAKVVDEENNIVPFGKPGELYVRGYTTMLEYWDDPQKTKELIDNSFWLKTGDQFVLEKDGYGKIVGRLKDMIIRGGENIFPREIEDFLNTHPDILETHVIGLSHERLGEEVCACVRVRNDAQLTIESIVEFCTGKLAKFKIPSQLRIVESFPTTVSGKIQKYILKQQIENK